MFSAPVYAICTVHATILVFHVNAILYHILSIAVILISTDTSAITIESACVFQSCTVCTHRRDACRTVSYQRAESVKTACVSDVKVRASS